MRERVGPRRWHFVVVGRGDLRLPDQADSHARMYDAAALHPTGLAIESPRERSRSMKTGRISYATAIFDKALD
jgi:hypothetical protein